MRRSQLRIAQISDSVYFAETDWVNWILLATAAGVTLIDGGYPNDYHRVVQSIRATGNTPDDLRAIAITHAHIDHIGALPQLLRHYPVPVYTGPEEARHARREYLQQANPLDVAANIWRPGALNWTRHLIASGAGKDVSLPEVCPSIPGKPLPVPGAPVPLVVSGHTSGHTCYLVDGGTIVATGDSLITGHPLSRRTGPQLLPRFFSHDHAQLRQSLALLAALGADIVLPGHGPAHYGPIAEAVALALRR